MTAKREPGRRAAVKPRTVQPRTVQPRTVQPRTDQPRTDQPRTDQPRTGQPRTDQRAGWPVPVGLLALSVIPITAGSLRLVQLAGGPAAIPADDRFGGFPAALVVHILGATLYAVVGAAQFLPRFRRRHLTWHRRAGRVLAIAGLLVAGSALWMTLLYPQKPGTGALLYVLRLGFASAMVVGLVLGVAAARRHDLASHRAWMIRAYAIALAAGTQAFTEGIGEATFGAGVLRSDLAKGAGWVINLAVAEWAIRRGATAGRRNPERGPARSPATNIEPEAQGALS
jgi:uncharacterized membrane protein